MKKIEWIGLGNMGTPMARNLERAGVPLAVFNRTVTRTNAFKNTNATISKSLIELVADSDIVFTMLSNDASIQSVYEEILAMESIVEKLFIDMSTVSQNLSESLGKRIRQHDASFLDAPVAGSTKPAQDGTLVIMVGGESADVAEALPYLQKLGKTIKHLGNNGKGIAAKLSINYYISIMFHGLAEAVLLAEKNGVNRADFLGIINESSSGSSNTKYKTPLLVNEDYAAAFPLHLMLKDVLLAQKMEVIIH